VGCFITKLDKDKIMKLSQRESIVADFNDGVITKEEALIFLQKVILHIRSRRKASGVETLYEEVLQQHVATYNSIMIS